jgi:hypothetical protein
LTTLLQVKHPDHRIRRKIRIANDIILNQRALIQNVVTVTSRWVPSTVTCGKQRPSPRHVTALTSVTAEDDVLDSRSFRSFRSSLLTVSRWSVGNSDCGRMFRVTRIPWSSASPPRLRPAHGGPWFPKLWARVPRCRDVMMCQRAAPGVPRPAHSQWSHLGPLPAVPLRVAPCSSAAVRSRPAVLQQRGLPQALRGVWALTSSELPRAVTVPDGPT